MPFEAQRFLHAANVRLDVPVSVHVSEQLTDELRHALEDATLTSFDSVVDRCIALKVDFLLLSGNVFSEADRSLRARLALLNGCRRLEKQNIPAIILPGDADPPEAWKAIPEMPGNVTICYASNPEPEFLVRDGRVITAVSASMWYGEADAFGIRVISRSEDGIEPLRIGVVSHAKFGESRRMAALTSSGNEDFLNLAADGADDSDDGLAVESPSRAEARAEPQTTAEYEAEFRDYIEQLMIEGQLKYVAYMGDLDRLTISLADGKVHCPGTTQPRNQLEADCGTCSLVELAADGELTISEINTSAVDWKSIDLEVNADDTLNSSLRRMKDLLQLQSRSESDRIWAVCWTVRGPLPVLQGFIEDDLELGVAVELEEILFGRQKIRLVHQVRALPDPWEVPDKSTQAQQYADLLTEDAIVSRRKLMNHVRSDRELSDGWRQRLEALVAGVDRERILARMRIDGAHWFVDDVDSLLPDLDDFDEDILQDEPIEEPGLTGDEDSDEPLAPEQAAPEQLESQEPEDESGQDVGTDDAEHEGGSEVQQAG